VVALNFSGGDQWVPVSFARAGSYREELHGIDNFTVNANENRWVMVPSHYGRIWTVG
jgi:hypothetical protein